MFGTVASRFNDDGVTALYQYLRDALAGHGLHLASGVLPAVAGRTSTRGRAIVAPDRERYLAEIAGAVRDYHAATETEAATARRRQQLQSTGELLEAEGRPASDVHELAKRADGDLTAASRNLLAAWPAKEALYRDAKHARPSLSGTPVPRVAMPRFTDDGERLRWLREENLPGEFPYTAGVFTFKREGEDPARMFAGEGDAFRTNRRFHLLSEGQPATRLSTAFDSVTLYGFDPDRRPDIYGKVGNSGVSIATLDDMKVLYGGFNLCDPTTSVSMTINGPAPTILAMFLNAAIDDQLARIIPGNETGDHPPPRNRPKFEITCSNLPPGCGAPYRPTF